MTTGGLEITVDADAAREASAWFHLMRRNQVPFATAKAQTLTIVDARNAIRGQAFNRFKLRSKNLPRVAVRHERAEKRDWPDSKAMVFVPRKFGFLELQERGGIKKARGGKRLAVPTRIVRTKARGGVVAAQRPRRIGARRGAREENGQLIHRTKARPLGIFYHLVHSARVRKRFRFEATGRKVIARVWPRHFARAYTESLRPPRPRRR